MKHWIETQLANGLPAFTGSAIAGTISVKQELVNDVLAELLNQSRDIPRPIEGGLDLAEFARYVKGASVRAESGTLLIDFKIAV
ncbi:MAG: hypothetical protein H0T71_01730 [Acidobacteria bacterium]|nr:hypothetical protein [Acidobacteriota bacterium]